MANAVIQRIHPAVGLIWFGWVRLFMAAARVAQWRDAGHIRPCPHGKVNTARRGASGRACRLLELSTWEGWKMRLLRQRTLHADWAVLRSSEAIRRDGLWRAREAVEWATLDWVEWICLTEQRHI